MPFIFGSVTGTPTLVIYGSVTSPVAEVAEFDLRFQIQYPVEESAREDFVKTFNGIDPNNDGTGDIGVLTTKNNAVTFTPNSTTDQFNTVQINQAPSDGTVTVNGLSITYTPDVNYKGVDTIGFSLLQGAAIVGLGVAYVGVIEGDVTTVNPQINGIPTHAFIDLLDNCSTGLQWRNAVNALIEQNNKYLGN